MKLSGYIEGLSRRKGFEFGINRPRSVVRAGSDVSAPIDFCSKVHASNSKTKQNRCRLYIDSMEHLWETSYGLSNKPYIS